MAECRVVLRREDDISGVLFEFNAQLHYGSVCLARGNPSTMDSARGDFFWHGPNMKRKYHMAKWELMASPKKAGGGQVSLILE
jgi:hypothetical protein